MFAAVIMPLPSLAENRGIAFSSPGSISFKSLNTLAKVAAKVSMAFI